MRLASPGVLTIALVLANSRVTAQDEHHSPQAAPAGAQNHTRPTVTVLPLHNGRNAIDLLGTGQPGAVIVSRRANGNAHGFSVVLFQVLAPTTADGTNAPAWQVIPFFGGPHDAKTGEELFRTVEGADCTLRDLRVIRHGGSRPAEIVIASREFGASFADSAPVHFDFYELDTNTESYGPTYMFRHVRTVSAKHAYCDVDDALDRELKLGTAGILRWDGPR